MDAIPNCRGCCPRTSFHATTSRSRSCRGCCLRTSFRATTSRSRSCRGCCLRTSFRATTSRSRSCRGCCLRTSFRATTSPNTSCCCATMSCGCCHRVNLTTNCGCRRASRHRDPGRRPAWRRALPQGPKLLLTCLFSYRILSFDCYHSLFSQCKSTYTFASKTRNNTLFSLFFPEKPETKRQTTEKQRHHNLTFSSTHFQHSLSTIGTRKSIKDIY